MNSGWLKNILIYLLIIGAAVVIITSLFPRNTTVGEEDWPTVLAMAREGKVSKIEQDGDRLNVTLKGDEKPTIKSAFDGTSNDLYTRLSEAGVAIGGENGVVLAYKPVSRFSFGSFLLNFLPVIFFAGLLFFVFRQARGANSQAFQFGRSRARIFNANRPTITFADVAGVEEAKQELLEVVEFLKFPQKFQALGARIPRGVLLVGPPGTGKTLLGRAVAGEAGVPFFSISGSEFVEMFVGVGASRVRDLFDQAKRNAPCIVFVDEIDAVGRHRGAGLGGSHDEREQTLNQILVEMDGFDTNTNVIVLSATNRPDILDPALLRPGRFDRQVVLDRPDVGGRKAILEVHVKGKPLQEGVSLDVIAKQTPGFSGADLANVVNEGAILAARRNLKAIGLKEMEDAIDRVIAGPEKKSQIMSQKEKEITAYHEGGHALVGRMLPGADPVHKVSIVARGLMGGYTRFLPAEDRRFWTRSQLESVLAVNLGGRAAERLIFGDMSTGSAHDIEQATRIARKMVTEYGMSDALGPRTFGRKEELVFLGREISEQRNYGDKVADEIDNEVHGIMERAQSLADKILTENRGKLAQIAETLMVKETLEGEELAALFTSAVPEKKDTAPAAVAGPAEKGHAQPAPKRDAPVLSPENLGIVPPPA